MESENDPTANKPTCEAAGLTLTTHLAEQFLNWYPVNTTIYFRGERGKDGTLESQNRQFNQLLPFFDPIRALLAAKDAKIARLNVECEWSAEELATKNKWILELHPLANIGKLAVAWREGRNAPGPVARNERELVLRDAIDAYIAANPTTTTEEE